MPSLIDAYLTYQFLRRLTTPFDQTDAFKLKLIDAEGNKLKSPTTQEEKDAWGYFDRLVFNLKKLIGAVPGGKTKIATYAAALFLLREEDERLLSNAHLLQGEFERTMRTLAWRPLPEMTNIIEASRALRVLRKFDQARTAVGKTPIFTANTASPKTVKEDAPVNSAGAGAVHGLGVGSSGESGKAYSLFLRRARMRRQNVSKIIESRR